jgi:hypothetical protein
VRIFKNVVEVKKAYEEKETLVEKLKKRLEEVKKQWSEIVKKKVERNEELTKEERNEWLRIRKVKKIRNMEKGEASKRKDHKDNIAEKKSQEEEIRDGEKEEKGKREFWDMIKEQEEREKQRRVEIRRKVMGNEDLTKREMDIWMEEGEEDEEKEEL